MVGAIDRPECIAVEVTAIASKGDPINHEMSAHSNADGP